MAFEERSWALCIFAVAALVAVWLVGFHVHDGVSTLLYGPAAVTSAVCGQHYQNDDNTFLAAAMQVEFPTPMDLAPIREVCAAARTAAPVRPGLLFTCAGQHGGIGMVRNQILKCVRYAMHAGAAGLVVPNLARRSDDDLAAILTPDERPLDYLLDRRAFVSQLTAACPPLRLYDRAEDFPSYGNRTGPPLEVLGSQWEPGHQPTPDHTHTGLQYPGAWRYLFDTWLANQSVVPSAGAPVHVLVGQSYLEYPVRSDGRAFSHEFGKILSFSNSTRLMAAKVLLALDKCLRQTGVGTPIDPVKFVNPDAYYGAHLRLESDALWAWPPAEWRFSRMEEQFAAHFEYLERTGLRIVYVASGNQTVTDMFAEEANRRVVASSASPHKEGGGGRWSSGKLLVVTKHDLLQGADLAELEALTFDQQALVDFLVLEKASSFMGVAHSSYSWNIALRRHELSRYPEFGNNGSDLLRDEYSVIMGMEADYPYVDPFVNALWP